MREVLARSSLILLPLLLAAPAGAVTVEGVPSPGPGAWTVDLTGTLRAEDVQALDRLGEEVKAQTGAELAVVLIDSTGGRPHREFATALANRWGIGDPVKNNGVLVFAALADRAAEIALGDGIDGPEQTRIAEEIMQGEMVPRLRAGEPGAAVFYGALACAQRILGAKPTAAGMPSESPAEAGTSAGTAAAPAPDPAALEPAPAPVRPTSSLPFEIAVLAAAGGLTLLAGGGYLALRRAQACSNCRTCIDASGRW